MFFYFYFFVYYAFYKCNKFIMIFCYVYIITVVYTVYVC